jgi:3-deoxy-7-phosphoheptulonate synthase
VLIIMKSNHTPEELSHVKGRAEKYNCEPIVLNGTFKVTINLLGDDTKIDINMFKQLEGVEDVIRVSSPYRLASRQFKKEDTEITVRGVTYGPGRFVIMGGPCAVESADQTLRIARAVKKAGANVLRGGAYKPRTSPYAFHGMGEDGLKILREASLETGLPVITEALDSKSLEMVYKYGDIIQIGTRNMQNFSLLREVGKLNKPVMIKRGMSATIDEWLLAAEYVLAGGNHQVMLCERGIRTFDAKYTRNVIDLGAIPVVKFLTHLPVVVDPSHGSGRKENVPGMSLASLAVGAHSILVDVHDDAEQALCDGPQALTPKDFTHIVEDCKRVAAALGVSIMDNSHQK